MQYVIYMGFYLSRKLDVLIRGNYKETVRIIFICHVTKNSHEITLIG